MCNNGVLGCGHTLMEPHGIEASGCIPWWDLDTHAPGVFSSGKILPCSCSHGVIWLNLAHQCKKNPESE
jgi:hypothetical protein